MSDALIKVTVAGSTHFVREKAIDVFGPATVQVGATEGPAGEQVPEYAERILLTLHTGMQIPIDESMEEFLVAARNAERDANPLLAVRGA